MGILGDLNRKLNDAASVARTADRMASDAETLKSKAAGKSGSGPDAKSVVSALATDRGARNAAKRLVKDVGSLAKKGRKILDR